LNITNLDAWKIWNEIPFDDQENILNAVWCTKCRAGVTIKNYSVVFCDEDTTDVCIHGKCSICGTNITRVL
jgi:hypothetical protein